MSNFDITKPNPFVNNETEINAENLNQVVGLARQGVPGPQGPIGPMGHAGPQGAVGPQGPTGAQGASGINVPLPTGFFRMEVREDGHLWVVAPENVNVPFHIDDDGHLIMTI